MNAGARLAARLPGQGRLGAIALLRRFGVIVALAGVVLFFGSVTPTFLAPSNLLAVLVNNFALLATVSVAMTIAARAGGLDLSVATAIDLGGLAFIAALAAGQAAGTALLAGLAAGAATGAFNAALIAGLRITPFLATLGTLFIGRSVQQLLADGGNPIYVGAAGQPAVLAFIGHGAVLGVPVSLWLVGVLAVLFTLVFARTRFGREATAIGVQPTVSYFSGLPVGRVQTAAYMLSGLIAAAAGIVLAASVSAYVPYSGNAFLLNAIGATFIGTTLDRSGRPNVPGTLLGVLLLALVGNGLLLIGWNFYWQQVGQGVLIFLALVFCFAGRRGTDIA